MTISNNGLSPDFDATVPAPLDSEPREPTHAHEFDTALPSVDGWEYMGCDCGASECIGRAPQETPEGEPIEDEPDFCTRCGSTNTRHYEVCLRCCLDCGAETHTSADNETIRAGLATLATHTRSLAALREAARDAADALQRLATPTKLAPVSDHATELEARLDYAHGALDNIRGAMRRADSSTPSSHE